MARVRLNFVGEGYRDKAIIPPLVSSILSCDVECGNEHGQHKWARLHTKPSTKRRLLFAVKAARMDGSDGIVATKDGDDRPAQRIAELREAKEYVKQRDPFLVAVGCPKPHVEAWLLDDKKAVCRALKLADGAQIPGVTPDELTAKTLLDEIVNSSPAVLDDGEEWISCLARISEFVDYQRCPNAQETGFKAFREEIRSEFLSLVQA